MAWLHLICWNEKEAARRAALLRSLGHKVEVVTVPGPDVLKEMASRPPDAVLIDLSRLPSQGRDFALSLLQKAPLRRVPLIFLEGDPAKLAAVRKLLPSATYTPWSGVGAAVTAALAFPAKEPAAVPSVFAGYSSTPLPKKLGIKEGFTVALAGAPAGFEELLPDLPPGARLRRGLRGSCDLTLWCVNSARELEAGVAEMAARLQTGSLWILWPKKSSGLSSDLSERVVRQAGLGTGLVDFKICAVDTTWSGLRFAKRRPAAGKQGVDL